MKKSGSIIWGLVLLSVGVIFTLNALEITDINLFFDGWWTLFIIIPCVVDLFRNREKIGSLTGIGIGVLLLLCCQDVLEFSMLIKLILPAAIMILGLKLVFGGIFGNKANEIMKKKKNEGKEPRVGCATFSGCDMKLDGEVFEGAELTATFGSVKCDLRNAIIEKDCAIRATAVFGGVDVLVSDKVNVKVNSTSIFGGVSNKTTAKTGAVTVYVTCTCLFGGVDIK